MARRGSRRWALVVGAAVALLALLVPQPARAQVCPSVSITLGPQVPRFSGPDRSDPPSEAYPVRPQNLQPGWINYKDCKDDIRLQFTILVSGLPCTDTIQVWAGTTDCTQVAARQPATAGTHCWPVTAPGAFAMATTSTGDIRAQDLVHYITNPAPPSVYTPGNVSACESQASPGGVPIGVYFMAVEADGLTVDGMSGLYGNGSNTGTTSLSAFGADLVGPYAPSNVTAGIGENLIIVNWTPAVDSTTQGFNIYCQNQGSTNDAGVVIPDATLVCSDTGASTVVPDANAEGGAVEAGPVATPDAAQSCHYVNLVDAGGGGGSSCVSTVLVNQFTVSATAASTTVDGAVVTPVTTDSGTDASVTTGTVGISDIPGMYLCGQVGGNTTNNYVVQNFLDGGAPIMDKVQYAVTVAATDGTGNTGVIGNLSCVIPSPVIDFWTAYTNAGGLAGGGFCALEGAGMPVGGTLFGLGIGVAALTLARRRRRR